MSDEEATNTYILDHNSAGEMARLLDQDQLMTAGMGGIFPERERADIAAMTAILDIACGPGGWVHEVASAYPQIQITGIDISERMIEYARTFASMKRLKNAQFRIMNALGPLDFPDASFDLVNMRTLIAVVPPDQWPTLLRECRRILRPGGTMRWTEGEGGITNKVAFETYHVLLYKAFAKAGRSFSPTGYRFGILPVMASLLRQAGFTQVQQKAHMIDFSYDAPAHEGFFENYQLGCWLSQPFIVGTGEITTEEYVQMCHEALAEMQMPDFCALWFLLTAWGENPT